MAEVWGLTGSFGSGKSAVARIFAELGVPVQDADQAARDVVAPGTPGLEAVVREFGSGVLSPDGTLDRPRLAEIVFGDPSARSRLNGIVHPLVRLAQAEFVRANASSPLVVLEIPLLLESGGGRSMARVIVVAVSEKTRFLRLRGRGFGEKEVVARLGAQMPQARKIELADEVIRNDGDLDSARDQVISILERNGMRDVVRKAGRERTGKELSEATAPGVAN